METKKPPEINHADRFVVIWPKKLKAKSPPIYYPTTLLIPNPNPCSRTGVAPVSDFERSP
jgi:hypothetical protein